MLKKKRKPAGLVFPNLNSTLASYDPTIQCIFLDCATREEIETFKDKPEDFPAAEKFGVLLHEMRHYTDQISTLWGHNNILTFQAAGASVINGNERKFGPVVHYMKEEYRVKQEQYYQEEYNKVLYDGRPWIMQYSTGLKFSAEGAIDDGRPIVFARFDVYGGKPICRVPITIASLMEVSAMSVEMNFRLSHIVNMAGEDMPVYAKVYQDYLINGLVYNQKLVVYNVAAHMVANYFQLKNTVEAYEIASKIATIALNMPDEYNKLIPVSERFRDDKGSWDRIQKAIINKDAGAVFLALTSNYAAKFVESGKYNLAEFLVANKLPSKEDFSELVYNKMLLTSAATSAIHRRDFMAEYYVNLLVKGIGVFRDRGIDGSGMSDSTALTKNKMFPAIFFGGEDIPEPVNDLQNDVMAQWEQSPAFRYHYAWALRGKMTEFFEIRGL